jgi:L-seryl-tRNA(Ser) seleniumtransferase
MVGSREWIDRARSNPLTRAMRVDKLTLAALEATLTLYRTPQRALREIPVLAQLSASVDELRARAAHIGTALPLEAEVSVVDSTATVGGGAFPTAKIPSVALRFGANATKLEEALRLGHPAVIGRVTDGAYFIDLRTILPVEDDELTAALQSALS